MNLIVATIFLFMASFSASASAGLFGAQNYNDCVLEKMKGQDRGMIGTARAACAEQFPQEMPLVQGENYTDGDIQYDWCETEDDSITVCVKKNESAYKITKVVLYLRTEECGVESQNFVKVTAQPTMYGLYGNKYKTKIENARSFKCMNAQYFGIKK